MYLMSQKLKRVKLLPKAIRSVVCLFLSRVGAFGDTTFFRGGVANRIWNFYPGTILSFVYRSCQGVKSWLDWLVKNFDHRKRWIEDKLKQLAANFGIDLLAFACLSNHFHLLLRSRPDVVATWDDTQVAIRWWQLCPTRKVKLEVDGEWESDDLRAPLRQLASDFREESVGSRLMTCSICGVNHNLGK